MKAKAAVFMGANTPFEVREFEVTKPPKGYGQSELIASGVCGTDLHFYNGRLTAVPPTILGHEFVGKLTDLNEIEGSFYGLKKGDNVIADIAVPCGKCLLCTTGDDANCVNMQVTNGGSIDVAPYLYGGFAEVNYTPLKNLVKIPEELDPAMVATLPARDLRRSTRSAWQKKPASILRKRKLPSCRGWALSAVLP